MDKKRLEFKQWWFVGALLYMMGYLRVFFYLNFFLIILLILRDVHSLNAFLLNPKEFITPQGAEIYLATVITLSAAIHGVTQIKLGHSYAGLNCYLNDKYEEMIKGKTKI